MNHEELHQKFRQYRTEYNFNENFRLRIHRAISWLKQSALTEDLDMKFISLWISFNAAYAKELESGKALDKITFINFIKTICNLDKKQALRSTIWETLSKEVIQLITNRYTYQPFWKFHNGYISEIEWTETFEKKKRRALNAVKTQNTHTLLVIIFDHLYTLRNQIIHGGATYNSYVNRGQLSDSCRILAMIIPIIVEIMMENPEKTDWGKPFYPVVKDENIKESQYDAIQNADG